MHLTPTEYEILKYLALQAGRVVTHSQVLRAVWGPNSEAETHYLRIYVVSLRRKIEANPSPAEPHRYGAQEWATGSSAEE